MKGPMPTIKGYFNIDAIPKPRQRDHSIEDGEGQRVCNLLEFYFMRSAPFSDAESPVFVCDFLCPDSPAFFSDPAHLF